MTGELNAAIAPKTVCAKRDAAERERIKEVADKAAARANGPSMRVRETDTGISSTFTHNDDTTARLLLMADLGTCDPDFMAGILSQVAIIGAHGAKLNDTNSNFLLSVVRGVQPRDELEAMLAVQMGAIHQATMMMARRLNHVTNIPQQDAAERALNKLARTYFTQMQALKRYRTGGQQKVTVEHVTVNDGGQAIVGNIQKEA
ncbi:hypothetical protein [Pararhodobacter oceanensis]|uniref:Uncharacterized protein n=1 Tax=Pararhodobacter oceanensis TaxID=2172121 RepID=A0A2T8HR48_9RHOB|nr:hypothetical protein [Pararhodobacter oceanensis]PVH27931.1 hypothetical protein DDE20_14255 [Pararhodobacter oceanensis]